MPLYGLGNQPFGTTGSGTGTPFGLPLAGAGYQRTFDVVDVRQIDPVKRDFVVDTTTSGAPHGTMSSVLQRALLALTTPEGQLPMAQLFGDKTLNLRKLPADANHEIRAFTEKALAALISGGELELQSVELSTEPRGVLTRVVSFRDLTTGIEQVIRA